MIIGVRDKLEELKKQLDDLEESPNKLLAITRKAINDLLIQDKTPGITLFWQK